MAVLPQGGVQLALQVRQRPGLGPAADLPQRRRGSGVLQGIAFEAQFLRLRLKIHFEL